MRVNRDIRNLLMRQDATVMTSGTSCDYLGKQYEFTAITGKEMAEEVDRLIEQFEELGTPWYKKIFKTSG